MINKQIVAEISSNTIIRELKSNHKQGQHKEWFLYHWYTYGSLISTKNGSCTSGIQMGASDQQVQENRKGGELE